MARINLLPENLREQEQKEMEKTASRSKTFNVEMTNPEIQKSRLNKSDKPKESFFKKISNVLGPAKTVKPTDDSLSYPTLPPSRLSSADIDLLALAKKDRFLRQPVQVSGHNFNRGIKIKSAEDKTSWKEDLGVPEVSMRQMSSANNASNTRQELVGKNFNPKVVLRMDKARRWNFLDWLFGGNIDQPAKPTIQSFGEMNEKNSSKNHLIKAKPSVVREFTKEHYWWKNLFSVFAKTEKKPHLPIKMPIMPKFQPHQAPVKTTVVPLTTNAVSKAPVFPKITKSTQPKGQSWWSVFMSMFASKPKKPKLPIHNMQSLPKFQPKMTPIKPVVVPHPVHVASLKPILPKNIKPKGPSWWSKLMAKFKAKPKKPQIIQEKIKPISHDLHHYNSEIKDLKPQYKFETPASHHEPIKHEQAILDKPINHDLHHYKPEVKDLNVPPPSPLHQDKKKVEAPHVEAPHKKELPEKLKKSLVDINFIPEDLLAISYYTPIWKTLIILLAVIVPASAVVGAYFWIDKESQKVKSDLLVSEKVLNDLNFSLSDYQKKTNQLKNRLTTLQGLLNSHIRWTKFFTALEKYTLDGVYYGNFSADTSGQVVLPATAKDYGTLASQIVALKNATDFVSEVKVDNISMKSDNRAGIIGVSFQLKMVLADKFFTK
ncbi:MAG: hypothetical protein WCP18_00210 [bacterium]